MRCPSCGTENADAPKFCGECGTRLTAAPPQREVRKTVTVLFCDVSGATALGERLDPESLRALLGRYFAEMKAIIERHGGTVEKFIGDAVMAVFGIPLLHEDDALRGVLAAAQIRDRLGELNDELSATRSLSIAFRTGITTGEVVAGDPSAGQTLVTGDTVNSAARLEQAAQSGEILLGLPTYQLVRDAVTVEPVEPISAKGKSAPLAAYRLVSVSTDVAGHARRLDAPLVGRERELDRLQDAFEAAVREPSCQLFTLLGTAGVGKSRLVAEFLASIKAQNTTVLKGRCLPYGEGITYWPLREIVHQSAGVDEGDSATDARAKLDSLLAGLRDAEVLSSRLASAIGLSTETTPQEEIFWATRKLLEHLARERPLVVLVEDIHWAEPVLLELLEHIADLARDVPLLLLCPARPELLDKRPGWGGGKLNATTVLLEALADEAAERLIVALPGGTALTTRLRTRILGAAEGNPLFVEEMLGMLIDERLLIESDGVWQADDALERVAVPPTVRALLAARLDQLSSIERAIVGRASVVGPVFDQAAIIELTPEALRPAIAHGLVALVRKELVRPEQSELAAGEAFKFRHLLIRDAAYDALAKAERAELHEHFAGWLERAAGERAMEYTEIIGYHLEQAHLYLAELGETDSRVEQLGERAGQLLARSGNRAFGHGDASGAADLFLRATTVLPRGPQWAEAATSLAEAESLLGDFRPAATRLDEVIALARSLGDEGIEWRARLERAKIDFFNGKPTEPRIARDAIDTFERSGDTDGLAAAWAFQANLLGAAGDPREAEAAEQALENARAAGNKPIEARALLMLAWRLMLGPCHTSEAVVQCERLLEQAGSNLRAAALVRSSLAAVLAMMGDFDRARTMAAEARRVLQEVGLASDAAIVRTTTAVYAEMPAQRYDVAEAELRAAYAVFDGLGETVRVSSVAGHLAEALARQGKDDAAEHYALIASRTAVENDYDAQVRWRLARALVLVDRGDLTTAESLARDAVEISARTDDINTQGACLTTLAHVLRAAGRAGPAEASLHEALARYEQKGNLVAADMTRATLDGLAAKSLREA